MPAQIAPPTSHKPPHKPTLSMPSAPPIISTTKATQASQTTQIAYITIANKEFRLAKNFMKYGFIFRPLFVLLSIISLLYIQNLILLSLICYCCGIICYMFGVYIFSKLTHSQIFLYNLCRFLTLCVLGISIAILIRFIHSYVVQISCIAFVSCLLNLWLIFLEYKIAKELSNLTRIALFMSAFRVKFISSVLWIVILFVLGVLVIFGMDLQYIIQIMDTQEFDLFIKDNVFAIFCFSSVIVIIYVSVLTSLLLYGRAYFSIAQSLILQNQKA